MISGQGLEGGCRAWAEVVGHRRGAVGTLDALNTVSSICFSFVDSCKAKGRRGVTDESMRV